MSVVWICWKCFFDYSIRKADFQYLPEITFVEKSVADKNTYVKYIHYETILLISC